MALPKQVQAQLAEVEELEKQMEARKRGEKPSSDEPKGDQGEDETPDDSQADTEASNSDEPAKRESKQSDDAKPSDKSPTDVADDFQQKYNTLRGKYDAEVPRLHQQVRDLTEQLDQLRKQVSEKPKQSEEPTKPKEKVSYVTDADRQEFGEELIDVQRRVAKEVAQEYEDRLEAQQKVIDELRSQVDNTGSQLGEMSFAQRLHQLVPDFAQIDNDERWIAWLNEYDPMLRGPRRVQAKAAFDAGDAEAVAHYVNLFKESLSDTQKQEPSSEEKQTRQAELEKQVSPNRSANSQSKNTGREAKVYTERELGKAWEKIRVLNTRGQYDDAAKLEAEITAAYLEGRVRA